MMPLAAASPYALPPVRTTASIRSISVVGFNRSVSRVPGPPPRTSTPPTAPPRANTTVVPVSQPSLSAVWWPISKPSITRSFCRSGGLRKRSGCRIAAGEGRICRARLMCDGPRPTRLLDDRPRRTLLLYDRPRRTLLLDDGRRNASYRSAATSDHVERRTHAEHVLKGRSRNCRGPGRPDDLDRFDATAPRAGAVAAGDLQLLHCPHGGPGPADAACGEDASPSLRLDHSVVGIAVGSKVGIVATSAVAAVG